MSQRLVIPVSGDAAQHAAHSPSLSLLGPFLYRPGWPAWKAEHNAQTWLFARGVRGSQWQRRAPVAEARRWAVAPPMPLAKGGATAGTGRCIPPPNLRFGFRLAGRWIRPGRSPPESLKGTPPPAIPNDTLGAGFVTWVKAARRNDRDGLARHTATPGQVSARREVPSSRDTNAGVWGVCDG